MSRPSCSVDGCHRPTRRLGFCSAHARQYAYTGAPGALSAPRYQTEICIVPGCGEPFHQQGVCVRHARLKSKYHLSDECILDLFTSPACAICGATDSSTGKALHVDHRHGHHDDSRQGCDECVRGLLCHDCNLGLGHFADSPELLGRAIAYLDRNMS